MYTVIMVSFKCERFKYLNLNYIKFYLNNRKKSSHNLGIYTIRTVDRILKI